MVKKPRNVFYINRGNSEYVRIASFSEYRENEMAFGFFGLNSEEEASYSYAYKDRDISKEDMLNLRINYSDAEEKRNILIDHFTVHNEKPKQPKGMFHLNIVERGKRNRIHPVPLPPPINSSTPEFLDFIMLTDILSKYIKSPEEPTSRDFVISASSDNVVVIRGRFSGAEFPLEATMVAEEKLLGRGIFPAIMLPGKTLKGGFTWEMFRPVFRPEDFVNRPKGTYFLMTFPKTKDIFLVKTFVFS